MSIRCFSTPYRVSLGVVAGLAALSSVALAADGSSPNDGATLIDLDYGANCVTNQENYTPSSTDASISLPEHRARAGLDGMYCMAEADNGYGFVAGHESGTRAKLAGEYFGIRASVDEPAGIAGLFENTHHETGVRLAEDMALHAYSNDSYCAAGVSDSQYGSIGLDASGRDIGVRGVAHHHEARAVVGTNTVTGAEASLGDGVYGVWASSADGPAAHLEGDLYVDGAYRGRLGAAEQGAPFPRPAFDSGWVYFKAGASKTLDPEIGGDVDNYKIEVMEKSRDGRTIRPSERAYGHAPLGLKKYGSTWSLNIQSKNIKVVNLDNRVLGAVGAKYIRVRIWYIV